AIAEGKGMRILKQDPWETLCCFILSQRKHIKAIRACVEALCDTYGKPVQGTVRKSFPTAERLAALAECDARSCGLGYRAPYLLDAARKVATGEIDFPLLSQLPDEALRTMLLSIHGVGIKVAECTMLFGFQRLSRAPVDVWIHRVIDEKYGGVSPFDGYGAYAGVYQQFMFVLGRKEGHAPAAQTECSKNTKSLPWTSRKARAEGAENNQ
ncbi:MAG: 8-oxoguanine DNA glycosylase, partial [Eubacteriales bacterium]|nr:8-oxoguanine DNA glycosylase [Eubacteriales bacterium]